MSATAVEYELAYRRAEIQRMAARTASVHRAHEAAAEQDEAYVDGHRSDALHRSWWRRLTIAH